MTSEWRIVNCKTGESHLLPKTFPEKTLVIDYESIKEPKRKRKNNVFRKLMSAFTIVGISISQRDTRDKLPSGEANPNKLSHNARSLMWTLQSYINFDCIPTYNGLPMNVTEIGELMNWSRPTYTKVLSELVSKDYMKRFMLGVNHYVILNPRIVYRGYSVDYKHVLKRYDDITTTTDQNK